MLQACLGAGTFPPAMTRVLVMEFMGWGWDDVACCPAEVWDDILTLMSKRGEAQEWRSKHK